jgi:dihydroxyacid dehydratase/phosphogluconate dehydratase
MDSRRGQLAHDAGRRVVEMVREDLRMSRILTRPAFENAARVVAAVGGSTNSVIHLLALAGRIEVPFELTDFDLLTRDVPLLADVLPCGDHLMEDLFHAGGIPVVMRLLGDLIHRDALTVTGRTLGGEIGDAACWNPDVIRDPGHPVREEAGIAVLWGNLAPGGAVIKLAGASAELMRHRGRAVVFESVEDMRERIDSAVLDVDEAAVLVLRGAGPRGYPGMPEVGNLPLPRRLLARGVTDMLRISDARMSGTAAGTVVLHVTPESAAGGTLGLVRSGDVIEMDVAARRLTLDVPTAELERRRRAWVPPAVSARSGYERLFVDHVLQADRGVDFDFLVGCRGAGVPRINH